MSMARCEECDGLVDTDEDCDFYVEIPSDKPEHLKDHRGMCVWCREEKGIGP